MNNNIELLIDANKISISSMAKDLEVSRGCIYRLINGGVPSAELMLKLSHYFNVDSRKIFFVPNVLPVAQRKKAN